MERSRSIKTSFDFSPTHIRRLSKDHEHQLLIPNDSTLIPIPTINGSKNGSIPTCKKIIRNVFLWMGILSVLVLLYIPVYHQITSRIVSIPGWSYNTSRDMKTYVKPHLVTSVHEPTNICMCNSSKESDPLHRNDENLSKFKESQIFLLIVVCSAVDNFEARSAIRETWGNITDFNYVTYENTRHRFNTNRLNMSNDLNNSDDSDISSFKYLNTFYSYYKKIYSYTQNIKNVDTNTHETKHTTRTSTDKHSNRDFNNDENYKVRVVFLLGLPNNANESDIQSKVDRENEIYNDIIQETFIDSYNNLTLKSVMMLKWVSRRCSQSVQYIMKTDDDMFVNVYNLMIFLRGIHTDIRDSSSGPSMPKLGQNTHLNNNNISAISNTTSGNDLLVGSLICGARPIADTSNKWYSPRYMYSGRVYPHYLSGTGYVMSISTAIKLYEAALVEPIFHLEDIYITGICSQKANVRPQNNPLFAYQRQSTDICEYTYYITSHHRIAPTELRKVTQILSKYETNLLEKCARKRSHAQSVQNRRSGVNKSRIGKVGNKQKNGCF